MCFVKIRNEIKILKKDKEEDPGGGECQEGLREKRVGVRNFKWVQDGPFPCK